MMILKTYTLTDLADRLRKSGMSIGAESLKTALDNGFLSGCVFKSSDKVGNYIIIAKDVDEWIEAHSVEVVPDADMLAFAAQMESEIASYTKMEVKS